MRLDRSSQNPINLFLIFLIRECCRLHRVAFTMTRRFKPFAGGEWHLFLSVQQCAGIPMADHPQTWSDEPDLFLCFWTGKDTHPLA